MKILYAIFGNRYYYKEAARRARFYFLGVTHQNLRDLALKILAL